MLWIWLLYPPPPDSRAPPLLCSVSFIVSASYGSHNNNKNRNTGETRATGLSLSLSLCCCINPHCYLSLSLSHISISIMCRGFESHFACLARLPMHLSPLILLAYKLFVVALLRNPVSTCLPMHFVSLLLLVYELVLLHCSVVHIWCGHYRAFSYNTIASMW